MNGPGLRAGFVLALIMAAGMLIAGRAAAQTSVEARSGLAVGSHTSTAAGLEWTPALSYEIRIARRLRPRVAVSAGYVRTAFGCREGFCRGREPTVTGSHAALGAELSRGWLWGRVGILYGTTRVGTEGETPRAGPGLEAGAGLRFRLGRARIGPGLSWRRMSADTPSSTDHAVALGFDLGVVFEFD
ncbi:MAG: hypothetical protein OXI39_04320 [Gemmatimonadota bacterium]|uniref:hypothetical protein n=1 Tax=Candidatus Palauibacter scopulicola TaxID=3056741 RepID=UPI00238A05B5|nr:hypothetical protein [Candidatus Palauibacter scopulicola]MDE2662208.1 hypothetical protein [Candidatus Palauibacter scopulicola]